MNEWWMQLLSFLPGPEARRDRRPETEKPKPVKKDRRRVLKHFNRQGPLTVMLRCVVSSCHFMSGSCFGQVKLRVQQTTDDWHVDCLCLILKVSLLQFNRSGVALLSAANASSLHTDPEALLLCERKGRQHSGHLLTSNLWQQFKAVCSDRHWVETVLYCTVLYAISWHRKSRFGNFIVPTDSHCAKALKLPRVCQAQHSSTGRETVLRRRVISERWFDGWRFDGLTMRSWVLLHTVIGIV